MQRKWAMLAAGAMISTVLAGCSSNHGELGNRNIRGNSVEYDMNGNRILNTRFANDQMNEMNRVDGHRLNSNNLVGLHKNYRLEMSSAIAERIERMPEVNKAYVMLTDDNAYVAVSLKDRADAKGPKSMSLTAPTPLSRSQQAYMRPYMSNMHTGPRASSISTNVPSVGRMLSKGMNDMGRVIANGVNDVNRVIGNGVNDVNRMTRTGVNDVNRMTRNGVSDVNRMMRNGVNDVGNVMRTGERDVNRVTGNSPMVGRSLPQTMNGTNNGMYGSTNNGQNYGTSMNSAMNRELPMSRGMSTYSENSTEMSNAAPGSLKDRIAQEVKRMSPQIKEVYVSSNPDFVNRMTAYMNDVRLGHPIQGFIAEFNAMVDRIFPHRVQLK
ncbi:YhcN/YlaJ family sporulation lipoprotein [Paenibacillus sp. R14(2021)]|uniref:YhcN/YlaJ family sporulation lipoprotein n=1 Tax=Paenibacillus sp. R14(2021) TaxID=2859228 RepID=UPI001C61313B|nr:YhcN/YlaJ family sporulation lipoprotein [Paenibacillus sp. R14(2021)]